jgi:hypothetical protein
VNVRSLFFSCVLTFHSPDGSELFVYSDTIRLIRKIEPHHQQHVAPGTRSVIYLGVRPNGFGVVETVPQVLRMIECNAR